MPKVSKEAAQVEDHGPVVDRHAEMNGYTLNWLEFKIDMDATPLLKGLPDDKCQCEHWGYVVKGRLTYRYDDHDETVEAGEAFYAPPGHIPITDAGTEYFHFSPTEELKPVSETITSNMQAMQSA